MFPPKQLEAARVAHNVNNALRLHFTEPSNPDWDELDEECKYRALRGVAKVAENPDISPKECHDLWIEEMSAAGYRAGPNIDPVRKEHPAMVPYSQLPEPQKLKTQLFISIVNSICNAS